MYDCFGFSICTHPHRNVIVTNISTKTKAFYLGNQPGLYSPAINKYVGGWGEEYARYFYFVSFSSRTMVYKGLLTGTQLLTFFHDYEMLVFGAVLMSMMIFMRRGLVPSIAQLIRRVGS